MNTLEELYRAREKASNNESFNKGYLQALSELETVFRDNEHLNYVHDDELVDIIWDFLCDNEKKYKKLL